MLGELNLSTDKFDSVVYVKNNRYLVKSSAALHVLKDLGGFWRVFFVFIILPKFIRDPVYDIIVKNRYRLFGKRDRCMIPTRELKDRFLE